MSNQDITWYRFRQFSPTEDLSKLSVFLKQHGVVHRFAEEGDRVSLWLVKEQQIDGLNAFLDKYVQGEVELQVSEREPPRSPSVDIKKALLRAPITYFFICLGVLGYIIALQRTEVYYLLASVPETGVFTPAELWRFVTPTFIHYGGAHILMNGLWLAILGPEIEKHMGYKGYLLLFFATALGGNLAQYAHQANSHFGGLSGVVYGYVGALAWMGFVARDARVKVMPGLLLFMLISLVLGFSGILDAILGVRIANWAHLGGLVTGFLVAGFYQLFARVQRK